MQMLLGMGKILVMRVRPALVVTQRLNRWFMELM